MSGPTAVIVTSINPPTPALRALAEGCRAAGFRFIVVGDTKSPLDFALDGCDFLNIDSQYDSGLAFARLCPTAHYARKLAHPLSRADLPAGAQPARSDA